MDSFKENKRRGIKVPRSTLLPPYMDQNAYYVAYTNAMDAVYGPWVDEKIEGLAQLRNMWIQNPQTEIKASDEHRLFDNSEWTTFDRDTVVKTVNMLGMKLHNAGVVSDDAYQTIARFVGLYWFEKGTQAFIEFINYCLGTDLQVATTWTENYKDFFAEGDDAIGTPVWAGGTWYPTTHVLIQTVGFTGIDILTLQSFFYEIANYNLVLLAIDARFDLKVVVSDEIQESQIIAVGLVAINEVVLSNTKNKGALSPAVTTVDPILPTTYLAVDSVPVDFATSIVFAEPTGWRYIDDDNTKKVPIYNTADRVVHDNPNLGLKLIGVPSPTYNLLFSYGAPTWVAPPDIPSSKVRIPVFTSDNVTPADGTMVPTRYVGRTHNKFLSNPDGFFEVAPNQWCPYWL